MPFVRVWIHYVWATKSRLPMLTQDVRPAVFSHIQANAKLTGIHLDRINGHLEHVHCLVSLGTSQTIDKVAQLLKGESSFWFNNKSNFKGPKLEWQDGYFAVSVSESGIEQVRAYIASQEVHHKKKTFAEEYDEFIRKYEFKTPEYPGQD